jgi:hypothetical protein
MIIVDSYTKRQLAKPLDDTSDDGWPLDLRTRGDLSASALSQTQTSSVKKVEPPWIANCISRSGSAHDMAPLLFGFSLLIRAVSARNAVWELDRYPIPRMSRYTFSRNISMRQGRNAYD